MFCSNCGAEIDDNCKFCPDCGARLVVSEEENTVAVESTYETIEDATVESTYETIEDATVESTYETIEDVTVETSSIGIGFSIAALVCGILSICCCSMMPCTLPLSIVAIVLGIISLNSQYDGKGLAIAGIITGAVGLLMSVILLAAIFVSSNSTYVFNEIQDSIEEVL